MALKEEPPLISGGLFLGPWRFKFPQVSRVGVKATNLVYNRVEEEISLDSSPTCSPGGPYVTST